MLLLSTVVNHEVIMKGFQIKNAIFHFIKIRPSLFELKHTNCCRDDRTEGRLWPYVHVALHAYDAQRTHKEPYLRLTANDMKLVAGRSSLQQEWFNIGAELNAEPHAICLPATQQ